TARPRALQQSAPTPPAIAYLIDKKHSTIGFIVSIMGRGKVWGKFTDFKVDIKYDEKDPSVSSVTAVIKTASIDSGIADRDKHLCTADFFDCEKYPEITFTSERVEKRKEGLVAIGTFAMRGVVRQIEIPFRITGENVTPGEKPGEKESVLGFSGGLQLNRREYGMNWEHSIVRGFVGDQVTIELDLLTRVAIKP
ncbi:MAG: YceI family protein, partial [Acidobacteria bacterium]|nr:YceI family protein [Acidobacteriota bacterium]